MSKQTWFSIIFGLITAIIAQILSFLMKFLADNLHNIFGTEKFSEFLTILIKFVFPIFTIIFILLIIIATILGSKPYPIQNVNEPVGHKFKRWQLLVGVQKFWSQLRLTIASGLIIISLIFYHGLCNVFDIEHFLLIFIVASDIILQFYVATGDIRNSLNRSISQLVVTLSQQIKLTLFEVYGNDHYRIRMRILIFSPKDKKFITRYEFGMGGEPDIDLQIGFNQGVAGRVFTEGRPYMRKPYFPAEVGLSEDQIRLIPKNIKWKMAFPLVNDHKPFGVLVIDCDTDLDLIQLSKILDYTLAISNALSILISQFPSREIQEAIPQS